MARRQKRLPPNPAQKEINEIAALFKSSERRLVKIIEFHTSKDRRSFRPLQNAIKREIARLNRILSKLTPRAAKSSTLAGLISVNKFAEKSAIALVRLPNRAKNSLFKSNTLQLNRDYKLVTQELGERLDKIVRQGLIKGRPGSLKTRRMIKPLKLKPKDLKTDVISKLLKKNIKLVDSRGRLWHIDDYANMVVRTRTREFQSAATEAANKLNGIETYKVSTHSGGKDDPGCASIDGKVFRYPWARSAKALKFPLAPVRVPVHPNCRHVETPFVPSGGF